MPRPSEFTAEKADEIVSRLLSGESMRKICRDDHMPNRQTVIRWQLANADFAAKCARAREQRADDDFDRMSEIEDDTLSGAIDPQVARVVLSSMQWRTAKLAPKKYGDKQQIEHSGPGGGPIQTEEISARDRIASRLARIASRRREGGDPGKPDGPGN